MGLLDIFRLNGTRAAERRNAAPQANYGGTTFESLKDPRLLDFMRDGLLSASGFTVNVETALRNPAMFRAVTLISNSIGMLPFGLIERETKEKAVKHSLHRILHRRPNDWQTAFDFRSHMQLMALVHRDGYARIVWSKDIRTGRDRVARLIPLDPRRMDPKLQPDWTMRYDYQAKEGGKVSYSARDIFHLRGISLDGVHGFSLVEQAREAIGLALSAELAAGRIFKNGAFVDGVLVSKTELSDDAYNRLKASWAERYQGADNAGKTPLLEGDTDYKPIGANAKDSEMNALRKLQVEEISRVSGVPRPLMMVDETSWGSGIQALGQFFVGYGLNPWFEAWQQAVERSLLTDDEAEIYEAKFNPAALLRSSLKEQGEYLARALGAGGHQPWMHVDEVRDVMDLPEREAPPHPMMGHNGGPPLNDNDDPDPKPSRTKAKDDEDDE